MLRHAALRCALPQEIAAIIAVGFLSFYIANAPLHVSGANFRSAAATAGLHGRVAALLTPSDLHPSVQA